MYTFRNKTYIKIPFGEIQYEIKNHHITIWIGTHFWRVWRGSWRCAFWIHKWPPDSVKNNRVCLKCFKVQYTK